MNMRRSLGILRVFMASWLIMLTGCAGMSAQDTKTPPRTIEKGDHSNVDDAKQVLIRTEAEWTRLWLEHASERKRPAIDFSKEMVVGVFMGSRPTAGFTTTIVSTTVGNGVLIVRYTEKVPAARAVTAQMLTFPFHLVAISHATVTDVKFEKAD